MNLSNLILLWQFVFKKFSHRNSIYFPSHLISQMAVVIHPLFIISLPIVPACPWSNPLPYYLNTSQDWRSVKVVERPIQNHGVGERLWCVLFWKEINGFSTIVRISIPRHSFKNRSIIEWIEKYPSCRELPRQTACLLYAKQSCHIKSDLLITHILNPAYAIISNAQDLGVIFSRQVLPCLAIVCTDQRKGILH